MQAGVFALVRPGVERRGKSRVPIDRCRGRLAEPDARDRPNVLEQLCRRDADDRWTGVPRRRRARGGPRVGAGRDDDTPRSRDRRAVRRPRVGRRRIGGRRVAEGNVRRAERDGGPRQVPDRQGDRLFLAELERPDEVADEPRGRARRSLRLALALALLVADDGVRGRRGHRPAPDDRDPRCGRCRQDGDGQEPHGRAATPPDVQRPTQSSPLRGGRHSVDDRGIHAVGLATFRPARECRVQQLVRESGLGVHRSCTCNARSRARRAVKSRDLTVPGGMPSRSPTSARDRPS